MATDTDTNATFDQRRVWLDELLAKPHLWPGQVATVKMLAAELGVEVHIYDLELSWNGGRWQRRTERPARLSRLP